MRSSSAGEVMLPLHLYVPSCEALRGSKVNTDTATSPVLDVAMVMPLPEVTGTPVSVMSSHIALGVSVRPERVSDIIHFRMNSDPATVLPVVLTVAVMESEGTADNRISDSIHTYISTLHTYDSDGQGLVNSDITTSSHNTDDL